MEADEGTGTVLKATEPFPYAGLPAHQNWRSAVTAVDDRGAIDVQGPVKFRLERSMKIASAGSCFARRIAVQLRDLGLGYVVMEDGAEPFSARYGNIYTSRQLVQLLLRALGRFEPLERAWETPGGYLDPFRPGIAHGVFPSVEALEADRRAHLAIVRELFAGIDALVFTLGLTEMWSDRRDGAAFPTAPGRGRGVFDPERHVFGRLQIGDVTADLERFIAIFREINPAAKLILTVSPVPLAATMMPTHVVRASMHAKSVLKVAAEDVAACHAHVDYFASYDAFMQNLGGERLFHDGERQPTDEAAERVVSFFVRDYFGITVSPIVPGQAGAVSPKTHSGSERPCDEDVLLDLIAADDRRRESSTSSPARVPGGNGTVTQVAHPSPLYFVGDSNTLIFKDRVFSVPGSTSLLLGRTLHTPGLGAFDFCDADGNLHPALVERLVGEHLLTTDHKGGWTACARPDGAAFEAIILFCGTLDWLRFLEEIGARDIVLPPEAELRGTYGLPAAGAIECNSAVEIASRYLEPLERGLSVLQSYGLRGLCLHAMHPLPADDETFARTFFAASTTVRYRSMSLMNYLLRGLCARTGTPFIDLWPLVTDPDGMLDPRYRFDAAHLNLEAAFLTVNAVVETLDARAREHATPTQSAQRAQPEQQPRQALRPAGAAKELSRATEDIADPSGVRLGAGWYPVERDENEIFRWAGDDATLYVPAFTEVDHRVSIELEPGPDVGPLPFTLEVFDRENTLIAAAIVRGRQTVQLTLPALPPAMHWLHLRVKRGGRRVDGDARLLDYRVFRIGVIRERSDVVSRTSGCRIGAGWYRLEDFGGSTFRWVNNDASIDIVKPVSELMLDLEPGPGVGKQPFTLHALDPRGIILKSFVVAAREKIVIPLPGDRSLPYTITLRVEGGGRATVGDSRTLNFRAFSPP